LIEEAKKYNVRESTIEEGTKMLEKVTYSKSIEDQIQKALADKKLELARDLYNKAIGQALKIDQKLLGDCKNQLSKAKLI